MIEPKTISELSNSLYETLDVVQQKKIELDKAVEAASNANIAYQDSVTKAVNLRTQLDEEMNKIIPISLPSRVRIT